MYNYIQLYKTIYNYIQLHTTIYNYIALYKTSCQYTKLFITFYIIMHVSIHIGSYVCAMYL